MLQSMTKSQYHALLEVILNVLKGTVDISTWHKNILKHHKSIIRQVAEGQISEKKRVNFLVLYSDIQLALKFILENGTGTCFDTERRI